MSPTRPHRFICHLLACLGMLWLTAAPVFAHHLPPGMEEVDEFEDSAAFMAGLRHPLLGMDHWVFAIVVGAAAAAGMTRFERHSPVCVFLLAMAIGAVLGLKEIIMPGLFLAGMAALMTVLVMPDTRARWSLLKLLLICLVGLWQGNQHGIAWPLKAGAVGYLAGLLTTTAALILGGTSMPRLGSFITRLRCPARAAAH